jgi:hypothetical protein
MDTAPLIASLVLAGVFLVAALSKLADRPGSQLALIDLGVQAPLTTPLRILLPLAKLDVATTLIPSGRSATVPA